MNRPLNSGRNLNLKSLTLYVKKKTDRIRGEGTAWRGSSSAFIYSTDLDRWGPNVEDMSWRVM